MIWNYAGMVFHNASGANVGGRAGHRPRQASSNSMLFFHIPTDLAARRLVRGQRRMARKSNRFRLTTHT